MARFTPITEKEAEKLSGNTVLPDGTYPFTIIKGEWGLTDKEDNKFTVTLKCFGADGDEALVFDTLLPDHAKMKFRFRHFAESIGIIDAYNTGEVDNNVVQGRSGKVVLKSETYNDQLRNKVRDYDISTRAEKLATTYNAEPYNPPYTPPSGPIAKSGNASFDGLPNVPPSVDDDIPF